MTIVIKPFVALDVNLDETKQPLDLSQPIGQLQDQENPENTDAPIGSLEDTANPQDSEKPIDKFDDKETLAVNPEFGIGGGSGSDAVTYTIASVTAGTVATSAKFAELAGVVNSERVRRRSAATITTTQYTGANIQAAHLNQMVTALSTAAYPYTPGFAGVSAGNNLTAADVNGMISKVIAAGAVCLCNCNYCTCDCNYCTCDCNYCTCNCNYCVCNCNYCTCNCNYCTCNCNYCTCNCNYCTCDCNYCTCNCNYACTCNCNYSDERVKTEIEYM